MVLVGGGVVGMLMTKGQITKRARSSRTSRASTTRPSHRHLLPQIAQRDVFPPNGDLDVSAA